jgi:hypothetical protein
MNNTHHRLFGFLFAVVAVASLSLLGASQSWAQEKYKISYKSPPGKYLQRHVIDVGDVPGHQISIMEIQYKFTADPPTYDGVKVAEGFNHGLADLTNGNGRNMGHYWALMENGDKIFSQWEGVVQTAANPDGSMQTRFYVVLRITGGTGRFKAIRGVARSTGTTDFKTGVTDQLNEGEYWFER